jgi:hypothetical protein
MDYDSAGIQKAWDNNSNIEQLSITNLSSYNCIAFLAGYGQNQVIFDRVIISYGVQFGLVFTSPRYWMLNTGGEYDEDDFTRENYLDRIGQNRLLRHYLTNFYVGIGVLLF